MTGEYEQRIPAPEQTTPTPETITPTPIEGNNFPKVTEFISQEGLEEKKDLINKILSDNKIKEGFEKFLKTANLRVKLKIKKDLLNCKTEEEVKSVIVENIPGYKIGEPENNKEFGDKPEDEIKPKENGDFLAEVTSKQEKEGQAQEKEGQAEGNEKKLESIYKKKDQLLKNREDLLQGHEDVDKIIREKAEIVKQQLSEETKKQLEEKGYNDKFIDDYILLKVTSNEIKNDSRFDKRAVEEFSKQVDELSTLDIFLKNIDNSCKIADTTSDSFSSKNISKTRTEMFNSDIGNDNLIKARDANKESNDYSNVFPEGEADIVRMYGKFVPTGEKNYVEEYNKHLADNTIDQYRNTQECQKFLKYLEQVKKTVDNKTKEFVEEMCILSQIKGMSMCIGEESENKFSLNKAREIEDKDGEITLKGHIDGVDIAIRHNSKDSNAYLETSSKFIKSDKDTFTISKEGKFSPSNFILPGQKEVFDTVTQRVKDSMKSGGILDKAGNRDEFLAAMNGDLQSDIVGDMENLYKDTALVHHYMKNKVRGEKIVNNSLSHIQKVKPNIDFTQPISPNSNAKLYPYFKIINFNIENSTAEEKNKLNDIISEIGKIINDYKNGTYDKDFKYPEIIENYLRNDDWKGGDEEKKFGKISDLFSYYSSKSKDNRFDREGDGGTPSKMVINDLYRDLFDSRNGKSPVAGEWQEEYNKDHADSDLDDQLSDSKDFPPSPVPSVA